MKQRVLAKTVYFKATPEKVWAFLTEPTKLASWFNRPNVALTGGPFEMFHPETGERLIWGEVCVAEPFKRLEYTFSVAPMGGQFSTVKWELEEVAGGTKLSLLHEGLPDSEDAFGLTLALDKGWDLHFGQMREAIQES